MKKVICFLLIMTLSLSFVLLTACQTKNNNNQQNQTQPQYNMVVLGDSIAEGVLGASPLIEREDYVYCSMVGQINNFNYHNRSISGYQTHQMLEYLNYPEDQSAYTHITHIMQADIIVISMFGNDYIFSDLNKLILELAQNQSTIADRVLNKVSTNIERIVQRLKELNPKATILWQTLYNPVYENSNILFPSTYQTLKQKYGIAGDDLYECGNKLLARLNQTLYTHLEKYPNDFQIVDVNKTFNDLYNQDHEIIKSLIYEDGIHPSNLGHAYIASTLQSKLEELEFASKQALQNYKNLCATRLERLFSTTTVNTKLAKNSIQAANSFDEVTRCYFSNTKGVLPDYNRPYNQINQEDKNIVKDDVEFRLVSASIDGGMIGNVPLASVLDNQKTFVKLGADGMLKMEVHLNEFISSMLPSLISAIDVQNMDLTILDVYIHELFPGNTIRDAEATFKTIENTLGIKLCGVDFKDANIKEITQSIKNSGHLPENIVIPDTLYFSLEQPYEIRHVDSLTNTDGFDAVYVGNYQGSEPYFIFTLEEDAWGVKTLSMVLEFMYLHVTFECE